MYTKRMLELYHVITRGVEGKTIFVDSQDHARFIHDLYEFNDQATVKNAGRSFEMSEVTPRSLKRNLDTRNRLVDIHSFCIMPNHTHLLLSPLQEGGISKFMRKVNGGYAMYFNKKYERKGRLYQSACKIVPIITDSHFSHIVNYIHFNPLDLTENNEWRNFKVKNVTNALLHLDSYRWSSYFDYIEKKNFPSVTHRTFFEKYFDQFGGYKKHAFEYLTSLTKNDDPHQKLLGEIANE